MSELLTNVHEQLMIPAEHQQALDAEISSILNKVSGNEIPQDRSHLLQEPSTAGLSMASPAMTVDQSPIPSSIGTPALLPLPQNPSGGETEAETLERLKLFLATAPVDWNPSQRMKRFTFPNGDRISCILWNSLFHITGTDIVKILMYRFAAFGRPVRNIRKFEEGVFSDLRNLKPGLDASLEEAKSDLLAFLHQHKCIRTQKKQKVFYWFSVPHDRLFMDALERDLKREALGLIATSESREKMDLTMTLEFAKQQCRPIIDLEDLEASNLDLEMQTHTIHNNMTPEISHAPTPPLPQPSYESNSTYMDLLSIVGPNHEKRESAVMHMAGGLKSLSEHKVDSPRMSHMRTPSQDSDETSATGEHSFKLYFCEFDGCNRSFKRQQHLHRHVLSHTGEKPFVCTFPGCGRGFSRADNLSVHQKRHLPPQINNSNLSSLGRSLAARQSVSPYFRKTGDGDRSPAFAPPPMPSHQRNYAPMPYDHFQQGMNVASLHQYAYTEKAPESQFYLNF